MKDCLNQIIRLLTFRSKREELRSFTSKHLIFGLVCTWVVGIGRWWEDPKASLLQHTGLGSVVYVILLSSFLWLVLWPLTPPHWSWRHLLTFISLTAPPALLYAIPVRHGLPLHTAQIVRLWLLALVATWRVALLIFYLRRGAGLDGWKLIIASIFPLLLIVFTLMALNLEKVVFNIMGGIHESDRSVNDTAYSVLFLLTILSFYAFLPSLAIYLLAAVNSVIDKHGMRWRPLFLGLSLVFMGGAVVAFFADVEPIGWVLVGASLLVAMASLAKTIPPPKNPESTPPA